MLDPVSKFIHCTLVRVSDHTKPTVFLSKVIIPSRLNHRLYSPHPVLSRSFLWLITVISLMLVFMSAFTKPLEVNASLTVHLKGLRVHQVPLKWSLIPRWQVVKSHTDVSTSGAACGALLMKAGNVLSLCMTVLMLVCLSDTGAVVAAIRRERVWKKKRNQFEENDFARTNFFQGKSTETSTLKIGNCWKFKNALQGNFPQQYVCWRLWTDSRTDLSTVSWPCCSAAESWLKSSRGSTLSSVPVGPHWGTPQWQVAASSITQPAAAIRHQEHTCGWCIYGQASIHPDGHVLPHVLSLLVGSFECICFICPKQSWQKFDSPHQKMKYSSLVQRIKLTYEFVFSFFFTSCNPASNDWILSEAKVKVMWGCYIATELEGWMYKVFDCRLHPVLYQQ